MIEELYFLDDAQPKITVASVGISRRRWFSATEEDIQSKTYEKKMETHRFDILPIDLGENFPIKAYFKTEKPNDFSNIQQHTISFEDVLPIETEIQVAIEMFQRLDRSFFFLTYRSQVKGLLTIGNLNCRQVQVYFFNRLCELERKLGDFIRAKKSNKEVREWLERKANSSKEEENKFTQILDKYDELTKNDLENDLIEQLYLSNFFNMISDFELYQDLDITKAQLKKYYSINEIRNRIAHPTRSLIDGENTIENLFNRMRKMNKLLFLMHSLED